jgi:TRAP-type C4-dicarboxylate transport system permease small subunit
MRKGHSRIKKGESMEIFFVYSLVLLFFVGFAVFCILILAKHPDREEAITTPAPISTSASPEERGMTYMAIAALFLFFFFLALQRRKQYYHYQLELQR